MSTPSNEYEVSVTGPGIRFERTVEQLTALAVMQVVLGGGQAAAAPVPQPEPPARRMSLREYLEESNAKSIPMKVAAIGRYLRDQESQGDFSRDEVKGRFRLAGEPLPKNLPRDFHVAVQSGWIAEDAQGKGRFYVTRRGDDAINRRFEDPSPAPQRTRRRRAASHVDSTSLPEAD